MQRNATCTFFFWAPVSLIIENYLVKFRLFWVFLVWGLHSTNLSLPRPLSPNIPQDPSPGMFFQFCQNIGNLSLVICLNIGSSCDKSLEGKIASWKASYSGEISAWSSRKGRPLSSSKGKCTTSVGVKDWGKSISSKFSRGTTQISPF